MIGKFLRGLGKKIEDPITTAFIYVLLPEPLPPFDRDARYGDPIDAELRLAGLGYVSGGGALLSAPAEDGSREIEYCGIDVEANDVDATRALLRLHLPELGCVAGTLLEYEADAELQDEYDGANWHLARPRPFAEPDAFE